MTRSQCSVEGCSLLSCCRGKCAKHAQYERYQNQHPLFETWRTMNRRCHSLKHHQYKNYGARGIEVCERWRKNFEAFLEDVGPKPSPAHSLDRYPDKNGNYEPGNVRWATWVEQNRNTRGNVMVTIEGRTQCIMDWALEKGILHNTLSGRLRRGWSPEDAVSKPIKKKPQRPHIKRRRSADYQALYQTGAL